MNTDGDQRAIPDPARYCPGDDRHGQHARGDTSRGGESTGTRRRPARLRRGGARSPSRHQGRRQSAALSVQVPHRKTWLAQKNTLIRHVEFDELGLSPEDDLPSIAILLQRPSDAAVEAMGLEALLARYWRLLFHARIDLKFKQLIDREFSSTVKFAAGFTVWVKPSSTRSRRSSSTSRCCPRTLPFRRPTPNSRPCTASCTRSPPTACRHTFHLCRTRCALRRFSAKTSN